MRWLAFLFLTVFFISICSAQELGLDGDSAVAASTLEDELKQIGMDDLLVDETAPVAKAIKVETVTTTTPEKKSAGTVVVDEKVKNPVVEAASVTTVDTAQVANDITQSTPAQVTPASATSASTESSNDAISSAEVSSVSSVDIQGSLEGYRSPLRAMLFSLAIPGAGQAYTKKYVKAGVFAAVEIAAIVGAVTFKNTGDEIRDDAHAVADRGFSTALLSDFYTNAIEYGVSNNNAQIDVEQYLFSIYSSDTSGTAVDKYIESVVTDRYSSAKRTDVVQGWVDAAPLYNKDATGATPFYLESGIVVDAVMKMKIAGDNPYGTSALQEQYKGLLDSSEKRYGWSQDMIVAILVNHIASATDAFIGAHRYNRLKMNEQVEKSPKISLENDLYRNQYGALTTRLDFVWKF